MKAQKVKGVDPRTPLVANAAVIARTRLAELRSFAPEALDPGATVAQHDMRIAAKRLRYVLETIGFPLGESANAGRRAARELQGVLGDLHDCDVLTAMVDGHVAASGVGPDRGLELLRARSAERREQLHAGFVETWGRFESERVWEQLEQAADQARHPH